MGQLSPNRHIVLWTGCIAILLAYACNRSNENSETYKPAKDWNAPQPSPSQVVPQGANPHMKNPHGGTNVADLGLPPPDPNRKIDESKFLRGTIVVTEETKQLVKPGAVVFLSVRPVNPESGQVTGPPLAVEKLTISQLPMPFSLSEAQAMIGGTSFTGDVLIKAWTDQDGDAMTKQPGDVLGSLRAKIPADKLRLALDTPRK